ncbi:MAG: hypothetical protein KGQ42_07000 [Alphaproteobacteria bacterium]|nr:hypothetical protein [Alphaproteobacteria bacterium]MDE2042424.1 hypothetical protein [Alphaproteobacteria bacterium]MDE2340537.1 hypothetical protein [Alphaproteobacteria bacterium]
MSALPEGFVTLDPYVADWAVASADARDAARSKQPIAARQAFHAAMEPLIASALDHLDAIPLSAHSPADHTLMLLALSYAHIAPSVAVLGADDDRHAIYRRRLPITRATADEN